MPTNDANPTSIKEESFPVECVMPAFGIYGWRVGLQVNRFEQVSSDINQAVVRGKGVSDSDNINQFSFRCPPKFSNHIF